MRMSIEQRTLLRVSRTFAMLLPELNLHLRRESGLKIKRENQTSFSSRNFCQVSTLNHEDAISGLEAIPKDVLDIHNIPRCWESSQLEPSG